MVKHGEVKANSARQGFTLIEVLIAMTIMTVAFLATLEMSSMVSRQLASVQSKNDNLGKAQLIEQQFESPVNSSSAITATFSGLAYPATLNTPVRPRSGDGSFMFPNEPGITVNVTSYSDFNVDSLTKVARIHRLWPGLGPAFEQFSWGMGISLAANSGGSIVPEIDASQTVDPMQIAPPPTGVLSANLEFRLPVQGQSVSQRVSSALRVFFLVKSGAGGWVVFSGFNDVQLSAAKSDCEFKMGSAYEFVSKYEMIGGVQTATVKCEEKANCGYGQVKVPAGTCVAVQNNVFRPINIAACVSLQTFDASQPDGINAYCKSQGSTTYSIYQDLSKLPAQEMCKPGMTYSIERSGCL